jgi:type IV pilus assembly protein PilY1
MSTYNVKLALALGVASMAAGLSAPAQASIALAEKPLYLGTPVKPSFIMALDDSGSMQWDILSANQDGELVWGRDTAGGSDWGFFRNSGSLRRADQGNDRTDNWLEVFPITGRGTRRNTVPAIPHFGFARSPDFNPGYYDPATEYLPWQFFDGTSYESLDTAAEWQSVRVDPRSGSALRYNLTEAIRDRSDDTDNPNNQFGNSTRLNNGVVLKSGWQVISTAATTDRTCPTTTGNLTVQRSNNGWQTLSADRTLSGNCNGAISVRIPANTSSSDHPEWNNRNGEFFDLREGMVIPAGTTYFAVQPCGNIGATTADLGVWRTLGSDVTVPAGGCRWNQNNDTDTTDDGDSYKLAIQYYAPTYYLTTATSPDGNTAPTTFTGLAGGPRSGTTPGAGTLYRYEIRPANYPDTASYQRAMTNFANWFAYYRTRNLALVGALTRSLNNVDFMRVGFFKINDVAYTGDCDGDGDTETCYDGNISDVVMHDMGEFANDNTVAGRRRLYEGITALPANGSTPNAWAVRQIGEQFKRTTGTSSPTSAAPIESVCQFNAGMLFTDGYHNQGRPTTFGNVDNATPHHGVDPFTDAHSNTLADIAAHYYKQNLRTDLTAGLVPVPPGCAATNPDPRLDCNRNLHMNLYGITLGAAGEHFGVTYQQNQSTLQITPDVFIAGNKPAWREFANDARSSVDDLWHATLNARGQFINATSPAQISQAMNAIIESINNSARRSAGTAASGARRAVGFTAYIPEFDPNSWTGDVKAYKLLPSGALGSVDWSAVDKLPAHGSRNILVSLRKADNSKFELKTFSPSNLGADEAAQRARIGLAAGDFGTTGTFRDRTMTDVVNFLRGDASNEGSLPGKFRSRLLSNTDGTSQHRPIGDILGSQPEVLDRGSEGYSFLPESEGGRVFVDTDGSKKFRPANQASTYSQFVATTKTTRTPVLIVGSNSGMIHGFNAALTGSDRGREIFAVVPNGVLGKLGQLARRDYAHTYYADGSPRIADACIGLALAPATCSWKSVAVMGMGTGGRSVIALDVTNPATGFTADNLLWEITSNQDADLGHVINRPRVFIGEDKKWYAAFGNGLNSANHRPHLFIVDLKTGVVTRKIALGSSGSATDPNGAISVAAVDGDGDDPATDPSENNLYVDTLYVNDFHGNVYKVNLSSNDPTQWAVDFAGSPLYTAQALDDAERADKRQFMTGAMDVAFHPIRGNLVYFGTGRYIANGDQNVIPTPQVQTFYAIWDDPQQSAGFSGRGALQQQTVLSSVDVGGTTRRNTSENIVNYTGTGAKRGWFIDLYQAGTGGFRNGERVLGEPRVEGGAVIFTAFQPIGSQCNPGGKNWLYALNAATGANGLTITGCSECGATDLNPGGQSAPPTLAPPIVVDPPPPDSVDSDGDGTPDTPADTNCVPGTPGCTSLPSDGSPLPGRACISRLSVLLPDAGLTPFTQISCGRQSWRQVQ